MDHARLTNVLRQSSLFEEASDAAIAEAAQLAQEQHFEAGTMIVWEGTASDAVFLIAQGIVSVKKAQADRQFRTVAYLLPGQTFGEVGILDQKPRGASVEAQSEVRVLRIERDAFMDLLSRYPGISLALARQLGRYLDAANQRMAKSADTQLIILFDVLGCPGATSLGLMLSRQLAQKPDRKVIYTEFPEPQKLKADLQTKADAPVLVHDEGFELLLSHRESELSVRARTAMMMDQLLQSHTHVVMTVNEPLRKDCPMLHEDVGVVLEKADQILLLTPPDLSDPGRLTQLQKALKDFISLRETQVYTLFNAADPAVRHRADLPAPDFQLGYLADFPSLPRLAAAQANIPEAIRPLLKSIEDRLNRARRVAIYLPTTIGIDQQADTSAFVDRTLAFMAERFGGATSRQAKGVWRSESAGLVGEQVHIVYAYASNADLEARMNELVRYISQLKAELTQEAMALEIDDKLTLI